ncbi:hypothetical protein C3481_08845 [Microbacterium sp. Ru50]|uniref:hypothetical protein n=1 Tax=Microbacterium sp. Ru50 TaxID=2080744 RepID=UPI000CDCF923|nr:hypothetical protein [Microbacterium sp. Ru50]POX68239.1 hypothetical protein C3481_08845 [Microbacterium sp. Ru50]
MTSRTGTRALKLSFAFVAAVLWAGALLAAMLAGINDGPSGACAHAVGNRPVFDLSVVPESVAAHDAWQLFPLGVGCRYTAPTGESVFVGPSYGPSIIALHALAVTVILAGVVVKDRWREPRRRDDLLRA